MIRKVTVATAIALLPFLVPLLFAAGTPASPRPLAGHWTGVMRQQGATLPVEFDFQNEGGSLTGSFTCATQRCLQYPLDTVNYTAPNLHFILGGGIIFDGKLAEDTITGAFQNEGINGTFSLERGQAKPFPYKVEEVRFKNGGVTLVGTLCVPLSAGRHPAILFLHGSGPESRWGTNRFWADQFARAGIASLCYDKRGCGASTGDWRQTDFHGLAGDATAAIHMLQTRNDINAKKIGLYGHSQGGFIAPLIASLAPDVAFIIAADSPGSTAYEQDLYRVRTQLTDEGYSAESIAKAMTFFTLFLNVARTGQGGEELDAAIPQAKNEKWFDAVAPPPHDHWLWKWYREVGDYSSLPYWEKVRVPVLLIYGERDHNTPPDESIRTIEQALAKAGNTHYAAILLPGAVHNDTIQPEPGEPFFWWHVAPGLADLQIGWVRQQILGKN